MIYATTDSDGLPIGFWPTAVYPDAMDGERHDAVPADAVEIGEAVWRECLEHQGRRRIVDGVAVAYEPPEPEPVVPAVISDRQFAQALAMGGVITEEEALAWASRGDLPDAMEAAIGSIPEDARFAARMLLSSATTYERDHQLVGALGSRLGYGAAELDDLWRLGATL